MKTDVFQDRVYVFTPRGDIIDLPQGSTPIDFAYHVHTEIGHRCRGAKVNGKLVTLDYVSSNRRHGRNFDRQTRRTQPRLAQRQPEAGQYPARPLENPQLV
jgi:hypothetical protein